MAFDGAFTPKGPTYLVGTSPVQILSADNVQATSVRVRNLSASAQYFTWAPQNLPANAAVTITVTAPTATVSPANTIGMLGTSIETFSLPANCWMQASTSTGFEVTPGEGL